MSELFLISINDVTTLEINIDEVKRYLKIHKNDTQNDVLINECISEIYQASSPRAVYSMECISLDGEEIKFPFDNVFSKNLSKNLCGCKKAYIFCATLGIEVDRLIQKYSK